MLVVTVVVAALAVYAHYILPSIQSKPDWTVVRRSGSLEDNGFEFEPLMSTEINTDMIRCRQVAPANDTATIAAGDKVNVTVRYSVSHPGPFQTYLARVPDDKDIRTWDPTEDVWFRIYADQPIFNGEGEYGQTWPSWNVSNFYVPIPDCVPAGDYLMRNEHIALHDAKKEGQAQFYLSCAQLTVTGGGTTQPTDLVAFPGAYKTTDPGLLVDIKNPDFNEYINPGPPTFTC